MIVGPNAKISYTQLSTDSLAAPLLRLTHVLYNDICRPTPTGSTNNIVSLPFHLKSDGFPESHTYKTDSLCYYKLMVPGLRTLKVNI